MKNFVNICIISSKKKHLLDSLKSKICHKILNRTLFFPNRKTSVKNSKKKKITKINYSCLDDKDTTSVPFSGYNEKLLNYGFKRVVLRLGLYTKYAHTSKHIVSIIKEIIN